MVHSTLVPALVIEKHGSQALKELLGPVARGDLLLSFAVAEEAGRWSADAIELSARRDADTLVLNGRKAFVADFRNSAYCLVAVRLQDGEHGPIKPALILVDTATRGLASQRLVPLAKDQECAVTFTDVRVPTNRLLDGGAAAVNDLMDFAAVFMACLMQGAARRATEVAAEYVSQREAFGQPIGAFQSIQHTAADMLNAVDGVQLLSREAVWRISEGQPARVEVAQAKSFANEKCLMACRCAQQLHGGIGFMAEFDINLWYRRTASWGLRAGTTYEHRQLIARALLDTTGTVRLGDPQQVA